MVWDETSKKSIENCIRTLDYAVVKKNGDEETGYEFEYHGYGLVNACAAVDYALSYTPVDTDGDGISDKGEEVEGTYFDNSDSDFDGLSDYDEIFVHGTDPMNSDTDGDELEDGDEITYGTEPLDPDTDNDGLLDGEEIDEGTDPLDSDTDNDYLLDGWEVTHSYQGVDFDPTISSDGHTDHDSDGLSTGVEVNLWGTNWLNPDCDNDGFSDGLEIIIGSDPLSASSTPENQDSDGDGLTDWEEYTGSCNEDYNYESTDWLSVDTDGDGWSDWLELHWRFGATDPNDPNSCPPGGGFMP